MQRWLFSFTRRQRLLVGSISQTLATVQHAGVLTRIGNRTGVISQTLSTVQHHGILTDTPVSGESGSIHQTLSTVSHAGVLTRGKNGTISQTLATVQHSGVLTDTHPNTESGSISQTLMSVRHAGVLAKHGNRSGTIKQTLQTVAHSGVLTDTPPPPRPTPINFGAKTPAGFGGSPCGYTGSNPLFISSGNTGSVWAIDSHNNLVPSGVYGAANTLGAGPYTLTLTDGSITFPVSVNIVPARWDICPVPSGTNADTSGSCQLLSAANSALLAFGDTISLRDGDYNPSLFAWRITRPGPPIGTWTGVWMPSTFTAGVYTQGGWSGANWIVIQAETANTAILETIIVSGSTSANAYLSFRGIQFNLSGATDGVSLINGVAIVDFQNNTFQGNTAVTPQTTSNTSNAIHPNGNTPYVTVLNNTFDWVQDAVNQSGAHWIISGNTITRVLNHAISTSQPSDFEASWNTIIGLQTPFAPPPLGLHPDFFFNQSSVSSGTVDHFYFIGNMMVCGAQVGTNITGQGIFGDFTNGSGGAIATNVVIAGNFYLGGAVRGISIGHMSGGIVEGNTVVTDSSWSGVNPSGIIVPSGTSCQVKYNATVAGCSDTTPVVPSTFTGNVTLSGDTLTDYQTYFANPQLGGGNTSLAQILTDWANKVGGPLDTPSPKVGAIGTGYVNYTARTTAFPY